MKAGYVKPTIVFEDFELNTAIATGCGTTVSLGPGNDGIHTPCKEYIEGGQLRAMPGVGVMSSSPQGVSFYEGSCSCYLSSVGSTLLTS